MYDDSRHFIFKSLWYMYFQGAISRLKIFDHELKLYIIYESQTAINT